MRDLEYFAVVVEHGHLGRAAEALGLGQPAISKCLRRLEQSMGAKLVKRTPKGVEMTAAGAALLPHVSRLRLTLGDVAREVADIGQGRVGRLRIGANQFALDYLLPAAFDAFLKDAPGVTLRIDSGRSNVLVPAVQEGQLDVFVGFIPTAPDGLAEEELMSDAFVVYSAAKHRLARLKRLRIEDLAQEQWALGAAHVPDWDWLHRVFESRLLAPPRVSMETSATNLRLHAVASSDLLGFAPRQFVRHEAARLGLIELRVPDLVWPCRLGARYRKDAYLSPATRRFIEVLKTTARKMPASSGRTSATA